MSVYTYTHRLFGCSPKVWVEDDALCARTNLFLQVILLFAVCRTVRIDRARQQILIAGRYLWLVRYQRRIPFDQIRKIKYAYFSLLSWFFWKMDEVDIYWVGVSLHTGEDVRLFRFVGEGSIETGWIGVLLGDDIVDLEGTQFDDSLRFVEGLSQLTEKTLT